jgi:hypothetical protein
MAYLPIKASDWTCRAPGREPHRKILFMHPRSGLRLLRCPDCDHEEIVRWFASPGDVPDPLTAASCCEKQPGPDGYMWPITEEDKMVNRWGPNKKYCQHCGQRIIQTGNSWYHVTALGPVARCEPVTVAEPPADPNKFELSTEDRAFLREMRISEE